MLNIKLKRRCRIDGHAYQQGDYASAPPHDIGRLEMVIRGGFGEEVYRGPKPEERPPMDEITVTADVKPEETARKEAQPKAGGFRASGDPGPAWVVIPTCNRPRELRQTLESVAAQAEDVDGVVVIDDGSDSAEAVSAACEEFGALSPRLIRRNVSSGCPNVPRMRGMSELPAHCMVVELDDHDLLCPGAVAAMRGALANGASFVYGDCVRFSVNPKHAGTFTPDWFTEKSQDQDGRGSPVWRIYHKPPYDPFQISQQSCYVYGARAYRRELHDYVGGWRAEEYPAGDAALFMRFEHALNGACIVKLDRRLTWVRHVPRSITHDKHDEQGANFKHFQRLSKQGRIFEPPELRPAADARGVTYDQVADYSWNGEGAASVVMNRLIVRSHPHDEIIMLRAPGAALEPHFKIEMKYLFRRHNGSLAVHSGEKPVAVVAMTRKAWFDLGALDERLQTWDAAVEDVLARAGRSGMTCMRLKAPGASAPPAPSRMTGREAEVATMRERRDRWILGNDVLVRRNLGHQWGSPERIVLGVAAPHTEEITLRDIMAEIDGQA